MFLENFDGWKNDTCLFAWIKTAAMILSSAERRILSLLRALTSANIWSWEIKFVLDVKSLTDSLHDRGTVHFNEDQLQTVRPQLIRIFSFSRQNSCSLHSDLSGDSRQFWAGTGRTGSDRSWPSPHVLRCCWPPSGSAPDPPPSHSHRWSLWCNTRIETLINSRSGYIILIKVHETQRNIKKDYLT